MKKNISFYIAIFFVSFFGIFIKTSEQESLPNFYLVSKVDRELFTIFEKIKKTMEIKESIKFEFIESKEEIPFIAAYDRSNLRVIINKVLYDQMLKDKQYSEIVGVLVHELEHHKQHENYPGSYNHYANKKTSFYFYEMSWVEIGADAAKAGYFDCPFCLKCLKEDQIKRTIQYFTPEDYDCYISRAEEDIKICDHCYKLKNKEISSLSDVLSFGLENKRYEKELYDLSNI